MQIEPERTVGVSDPEAAIANKKESPTIKKIPMAISVPKVLAISVEKNRIEILEYTFFRNSCYTLPSLSKVDGRNINS